MAYNLPVELFTELGIGILIFALRFYARWKTVGPHNFGYDDLFAGIAVVGSLSSQVAGVLRIQLNAA
jgi:hypothetical protein